MEFEVALDVANDALFASAGRRLSPIETAILQGAWQRQTYEHIAAEAGYSDNYLKLDVGPKLWKLLSEAFGEKVTKPTFQAAVERQWRRQDQPASGIAPTVKGAAKPWGNKPVTGWPHPGLNPAPGEGHVGRPDSPSLFAAVPSPAPPTLDWGEAPDISIFYGRSEELATLSGWILDHRCRLVTLLGIGGIGKSSLAAKITHTVQNQFEFVIWRSLRNAPPLKALLADLIPFLSQQQDAQAIPERLLYWLRLHRSLVILDNLETIMQPGCRAGYYLPGYENYGDLLRSLGETGHQSCVVLTSREKPAEISLMESADGKVRSCSVKGSRETSLALLDARGLSGSETDKQSLCEVYDCSPLAIKIVAASIQTLFAGQVGAFLKEETIIFNGIRRLLDQQFERLSELEQAIMYWLAIDREWISMGELETALVPSVPRHSLLETLESLSWRSLIETSAGFYTQQPVVMEYVTNHLIEQVAAEIVQLRPRLFNSHGLIKTTLNDYLRASQGRLIVQPLLAQVTAQIGAAALKPHCQALQALLKQDPGLVGGYGAGNLINLAVGLGFDLSGCDLSGLTIRHAHLRGVTLRYGNLSHTHHVQTTFTQPFGSILAVAFSPAGQSLATADNNGKIYHWTTEGALLQTLRGHTNWIWSVVFSPDGTRLLSSSEDQTIRLWDVGTGQCLQVLRDHSDWVWAVVFSPDGAQFASASNDQTLRLWNAATGQVEQVLVGHQGWVQSVAYSPDGRWLVSGGADQTLGIWDTTSGERLQTLTGHHGAITAVSHHPHQPWVASAGEDHAVRVWDLSTGQATTVLQGHGDRIRALRYSPDGTLLASAGEDGTVRFWDATTGQPLRALRGHGNAVADLAFSPGGDQLITGSEDQTARLWDVQTGQVLRILQGYTNGIQTVAFVPLTLYARLPRPPIADSPPLTAGCRLLASGSEDGIVRLWDTHSGEVITQLEGHNNAVRSVAFSPLVPILASGSHDHTVRLWDWVTGQPLAILRGHRERVRSVAFSPDGRVLASSSDDCTIRLWETASGRCTQVLAAHTNIIMAVVFSPNGQLLASASDDLTVRLWEAASGETLAVLRGHNNWVWSVAFSPDGLLLASGGDDLVVQLWDVSTGKVVRSLAGHQASITAVGFAPDGKALITASNDATVRVWCPQTGQCLHRLRGHRHWVMDAIFSPDGRCIASSSDDATIRLWAADTGTPIRTLRPERPYEGLNITGATGLTPAQMATLIELGAVDHAL